MNDSINLKGKSKTVDDKKIKLKELISTQGPVEAEVIKSFLKSNGIDVIFRGQVVQSVHAFTADGLGKIKIFVQEEDYKIAKELLKKGPNSL